MFVGNLGFVDDETAIRDADGTRSSGSAPKIKTPADYEEGLWRVFGQVGAVESVRFVRDRTTQMSKGFAYVQFKVSPPQHSSRAFSSKLTPTEDPNAVEKALLYSNRKFPPTLPRTLRVMRTRRTPSSEHSVLRKGNTVRRASTGVNGRLYGRAKAAQLRRPQSTSPAGNQTKGSKLVFEGRRATSYSSLSKTKRIKRGNERSKKRAADFKRRIRAKAP